MKSTAYVPSAKTIFLRRTKVTPRTCWRSRKVRLVLFLQTTLIYRLSRELLMSAISLNLETLSTSHSDRVWPPGIEGYLVAGVPSMNYWKIFDITFLSLSLFRY